MQPLKWLTILCLLSSAGAWALAPLAQSNIYEHTLANGLRILVKVDRRAPVMTSYMYYKVGAVDENAEQTGLSHALEHMMFKGTAKVSGDDFTRINSKFGGSNNAFTTNTYTGYYQTYPAAYMPLALELEADRMQNLRMKEADFDKEIKVVMEERRQRTDDNPKSLAYERFRLAAYPTSPLRLPVIGHMDRLQSLKLSDLQQWYKTWYAPNNAVLVVVGNVEPGEVVRQAQRYFGAIVAKRLPSRLRTHEVQNYGQREVSFFLPIQVPHLYMAWNLPSLFTLTDPADAYALVMLAQVLDGGASARLETEVIRAQRIASAISSSYDPFEMGGALLMLSAVPEKDVSLRTLKDALLQQVNKFKTQKVDAAELARVFGAYKAAQVYQQDEIEGQARMIGDLAMAGLDVRLVDDFSTKLQQVSPDDTMRVAKRYFNQADLTVAYLAPEKMLSDAAKATPKPEELPSETDVITVDSPPPR